MLLTQKKTKVNAHLADKVMCNIGFKSGDYSAKMTLSTVSANTWIPTNGCTKCFGSGSSQSVMTCDGSCSKTTNSVSFTSLPNLKRGVIVSGVRATDNLVVSKAEAKSVDIILAKAVNRLNHIKSDGVLGLGYSKKNLLARLKDSHKIKDAIMAFYFGEKSFVTFGDYMRYMTKGDFKTYSVKDIKN